MLFKKRTFSYRITRVLKSSNACCYWMLLKFYYLKSNLDLIFSLNRQEIAELTSSNHKVTHHSTLDFKSSFLILNFPSRSMKLLYELIPPSCCNPRVYLLSSNWTYQSFSQDWVLQVAFNFDNILCHSYINYFYLCCSFIFLLVCFYWW